MFGKDGGNGIVSRGEPVKSHLTSVYNPPISCVPCWRQYIVSRRIIPSRAPIALRVRRYNIITSCLREFMARDKTPVFFIIMPFHVFCPRSDLSIYMLYIVRKAVTFAGATEVVTKALKSGISDW